MKKNLASILLVLLALVVKLQVFADNAYGLKDNIQDGVILHCFDWKLADIQAAIPDIAQAGFTAVQTSPLHQGEGTGGAWYMLYQPYDYVIGNGLGTQADLTALCTTAHAYGVKVIVDVVANHTKGDLNYVADYWKNTDLYHTYGTVTNWNDRYQVTHGEIGMKDLKTEDSRVQGKIKAYVAALKSCGVDGIRWDAAKHIGLPSEGDTFWANVPDQSMYNYGEILDGTGGSDVTLLPEYQTYMSITDNGYGNGFADAFNSGSVSNSIGNFNQRGASTTKLVYWGESHDTYSNGGGTSAYSQNVIDRAYAVVAGNAGATALYFSRPSQTAKDAIKIGDKGSTHFTSTEVAEVNRMHNVCAGEANYYVHSGNVAAQVRKSGAIIVLGNGSNQSISVANGAGDGQWLTPGTYTDKVGGATFTVTTSTISGQVGSTGIAVIYTSTATSTTDTSTSTDSDVYTPTVNEREISCFIETSKTGTVKAWVWDATNGNANYTGGTWPGEALTLMGKAANGNNIYKWTYTGTLTAVPTGVIFTVDGTKLTAADGTFTNHGYYVEGATTASATIAATASSDNGTDTETDSYTPTVTADEISCFLETAKSGTVKAWIWDATNGNANYTGGTWPGEALTLVGEAANGNNIYKWTYTGTLTAVPTGVIFTVDGTKLTTADGTFTNHGYYVEGATTASTIIEPAETPETPTDTTSVVTTVNVDMTAANTTYTSTYDLDFTDVEGLNAYIASGYVYRNGTLTLVLTRLDYVPANTGVVLKGVAGTSYTVPVGDARGVVANLLVGVTASTLLAATDGDNTNMVLDATSGDFAPLTSAVTLAAGEAYLPVPTLLVGTGAQAKKVPYVFDDTTTGITAPTTSADNTETMYNMQGMRVSQPTHGVYIVNGKKMVK